MKRTTKQTCSVAIIAGLLLLSPFNAHAVDIAVTSNSVGIATATPDSDYVLDTNGDSIFRGSVLVDESSSYGTAELSPAILEFTRNGSVFIDQSGGGALFVRTGTTLANRIGFFPSGYSRVYGELEVSDMSPSGGAYTDLCHGSAGVLGACSSSKRYKTDIKDFLGGLDIVDKLRPVSFKWTEDKIEDVGLIAEEVAAINKNFATYTKDGKVQGVKYKQLVGVLANAIKEQQRQIDTLQKQVEALNTAKSGR